MSSRAFRRLQKDVIKIPACGEDRESDREEKIESNIVLQPQKKKQQIINPFELVRKVEKIMDFVCL